MSVPEACPQVRVRYADTDRMGYAYYANFLVWFEVGRNEWMREHGVPYVEIEEGGHILPVVSAEVRYMKPARYDDLLDVRTWAHAGGLASISFRYEVARHGELLATGTTLHACTGKDGKVTRMPNTLRQLLRPHAEGAR